MRLTRLRTAFFICCALFAAEGKADPYDLHLAAFGNPATSPEANAKFRAFARELGAALTSTNLMSPDSLGHSGFALSADVSVAQLRSGAELSVPTEQPFAMPLLIPSAHIRKGLPFSFEVGGRAAWIEKSRMAAATLEAKWAINEGFSYLPDLGVRGYATRLFNSGELELTALGLDLGLGKEVSVGGMLTLTPYLGWNLVWVGASTSRVDFNPNRSNRESISTRTAQLDDTGEFEPLTMGENQHSRFYAGLRFIGGAVMLGAEISYAPLGRFKDSGTGVDHSMPSLLVVNGSVGIDF